MGALGEPADGGSSLCKAKVVADALDAVPQKPSANSVVVTPAKVDEASRERLLPSEDESRKRSGFENPYVREAPIFRFSNVVEGEYFY